MQGAIRLAMRLMPDVREILVYVGERLATSYVLDAEEGWVEY